MDKLDYFARDINNYLKSQFPETYSFACIVNKRLDSFNIPRNYNVTLVCNINGEHVRTLQPDELIDTYEHWLNEYNTLSGLDSHWQIEIIKALKTKI